MCTQMHNVSGGHLVISVIVPVYNVERWLDRCVTSIVGQTYKNLEIILIDDGSTDKSSEMCDAWSRLDNRIRVIHKANGGLSSARNAGLGIATGTRIAFVDSDDWIEPDMYEFLYHLLKENGADISICSHYIETAVKTRVKHSSGQFSSFSREEAIRTLVEDKRIRNYMWDKLYKRQLFAGIYFPVNRVFEDIAVSYQIFYKTQKVVMQDCPKYHYLKREGSTTQGKLYNYEKEYLLFQTVYEQVKFVREKEIWDKAPYCVHERGIHLIDHLMMLPQSSLIDDVINDVLARMQEFDNVSWPQLDVMHIFKRRMMYCHLKVYRCIYRLVRTFFKSKRYKFQTL